MSFDYRRNSDYLSEAYQNGTPRNCVLEVTFSDQQGGSGSPSGVSTLVYTATGNETSFTNALLINSQVLSLSRDGLEYSPVETFSVTPKKEFIADVATGLISFHPSLPGMMAGEDSVVIYIAEGDTPVGITEPVTLQQAKAWLKVEVDDDDLIISALIPAARKICESYAGLSFVTRTVTAILKNELGNIMLPYGPVNMVTGMFDCDDSEIDSGEYAIQGGINKRIKYPVSDYIKVEYTTGYAALPKVFVTAILMQLTWCYQRRGDTDGAEISPEAKIILSPYRVVV